jgi:cytochrome bd ubiquinol oxidase subunit II
MATMWFWLVAALFAVYVLLDGYDLGAGILYFVLPQDVQEKKQILSSIGPFWDANEVWLIAGGGTLFCVFPPAYAASFSGFYLPLIIVLWLLIARGLSIEFHHYIKHPVWTPLWDAGFFASSLLLALFFGVALGNLLRGLPLNKDAEFFLPLWTNFSIQGELGVLDWYTISVGLLTVAGIALHGALWIAYKVGGRLEEAASTFARRAIWAVAALAVWVTLATFSVQQHARHQLESQPIGVLFPIVALAALAVCAAAIRAGRQLKAFFASSVFHAAMLGTAAFTLFPYVLRSNVDPKLGLTIYNSNPGDYAMKIALGWWIPGIALAAAYSIYSHRRFAAKITSEQHAQPY